MSGRNTALVAKARAIYGKRVTDNEYNILLHKTSVPQVVNLLKTTARYRKELEAVDEQQIHREQIELLLNQSVFDIYLKLCRFVPNSNAGNTGNRFIGFYIRKAELEIILNTVHFLNSGQRDRIIFYLPAYLERHVNFTLMDLGNVENFNDLINILRNTCYYKILNSFGGTNFEELSAVLYTDYYERLSEQIKNEFSGEEADLLSKTVQKRIAFDNLMMIYRMKTYFNRPPEEIKGMMTPFYSGLSKNDAEVLLNAKNADELIAERFNKKYLKHGDVFDRDFPEIAAERGDFRLLSSKLRITQSWAFVIFSLVRLLEIEKQNVFNIIEGVRYQMPAAEIERLLVF
ncbi:MAG: V-type ATPase subunit [Oscillospiraceae bacterium]|nr:V-type ATPase subunit [Oscillospiraceae bacterium]